MPDWLLIVAAVCAVVVTVALVLALAAIRGVARRADRVLAVVEQELRPVVAEVLGLTEDTRELTRDARSELARLREVTQRLNVVAVGLGRVVGAVAGLTRAGQLVTLTLAVKKGLYVFARRLRTR